VEFLDGDLDRPIITGRVYNTAAHQNILDFRRLQLQPAAKLLEAPPLC